jgi:hypothetical protein
LQDPFTFTRPIGRPDRRPVARFLLALLIVANANLAWRLFVDVAAPRDGVPG